MGIEVSQDKTGGYGSDAGEVWREARGQDEEGGM